MTLLMICKDVELVSAILDLLYEITNISEDAAKRVATLESRSIGNPVIFIVHFLNYERGPRPMLSGVSCASQRPVFVSLKRKSSGESEVDEEVESGSVCRWEGACGQTFEDEEGLVAHVFDAHAGNEGVYCKWKGCADDRFFSQVHYRKHLMIHYPLPVNEVVDETRNVPNGVEQRNGAGIKQQLQQQQELSGVSLTAL